MAQPIWITPVGSIGVIPVGVFYQTTLLATDPGLDELYYEVIAGRLPDGVQCAANGLITGTPAALASLQGIPLPVGRDTTSKFTVRAYAEHDRTRFADRTFSLTVSVAPGPLWTTPAGSIGEYYDSDQVDFQFQFTESYAPNTTVVDLYAGQLPGGLTLSPDGLLTGYIQPTPNVDAVPGYDITALYNEPYDFISQAQSKNFQFTLRVSDGKKSDLRTFTIFVYSRDQMQASDNILIDNNTFVDASETTERAPFLTNALPSNLGIHRSSNNFAYQFVGEDYDNSNITYAISVNQGEGLPPGLTLDPVSGWYYGYIPDQGVTEVEYSFNIVVYQSDYVNPRIVCTNTQSGTNRITCEGTGQLQVGQPMVFDNNFGGLVAGTTYHISAIVSENVTLNQTVFTLTGAVLTTASGSVTASLVTECTATTTSTNEITCFSTEYLGVGQPIVFTGTAFGGVTAAAQTIYYVSEVTDTTHFKISASPALTSNVVLTTASGTMKANLIVASQAYPYTMTITGAVDSEVTWITPTDLGSIVNGSTSILKIEAENRGGRTMAYRLKPGAGPLSTPPYVPGVYNLLPQGLELLPSGDIVGRVSFDTFALDLGTTTFDRSFAINRNVASLGTTFDSTFTFTVNAYAPDTNQLLYQVANVVVNDGGSGYSSVTPPTIVFSSPVGASAVTALAGNVTVAAGKITSVAVADPGLGYTAPATVSITQGFGGSGANLTAQMKVTGSRDAISVFKTFTVRVVREYNKPYQNLYIQAMPPPNDRALIRSLLDNEEIFVPEYIYRPDDPNFGKAREVVYYHAFGLEPDTLERYVASLYENHYWKNLVLGEIETAQALDAQGNVIYEVVYSRVIDDLLNAQGQSVSKVVPLPYAIVDPADGSTLITAVFPNSLTNMRNQVIDVVGQIDNVLPAWMTSKQTNGRVLGFTPAWVIAYTQPGRSRQIAYYLQEYFGTQLNTVDFKVDRYVLDRVLSRNWDTETQRWTPESNMTTFDRFGTGARVYIGQVSLATSLAYTDVNQRTPEYINSLGGLDGQVVFSAGDTIIFVKQQDYDGPPGSSYATIDDGWQDYSVLYGDEYSPDGVGFSTSSTIPNSPVDQRMAIYTIGFDANGLVTLTLTTQPVANDYVQVQRGNFYRTAFLYYPTSPGEGLTEISWLFLPTVVTTETVFDANSLQFIEPVDMYDPTDTYDKYLVFPKSNILV